MADEIQKNIEVDVSRVLRDHLEREMGREDIDGMSPDEAVQFVDLTIGYTPVVIDRFSGHMLDIPKPVNVITDGSKFAAVWERVMLNGRSGGRDFRNLLDAEHKMARARYLLLRGYYYKHFERYSYPEQRRIIAWYFGGVMWRPQQGTELHRLMIEQQNVESTEVTTNERKA